MRLIVRLFFAITNQSINIIIHTDVVWATHHCAEQMSHVGVQRVGEAHVVQLILMGPVPVVE